MALLLAACGNGSLESTQTGAVDLQVGWGDEPDAAAASSGNYASQSHGLGGFGDVIPKAVRRVRITYQSQSTQCCVAFDPRDARLAGRNIVLTNLLPENATISLAGFPTDFAPSGSLPSTCSTSPAEVALPCAGQGFATASFASEIRHVTVVGGSRTDAGELRVFPVPFLVDGTVIPAPGGVAGSPMAARFTIADAGIGVDAGSIAVNGGQLSPPLDVGATIASKTACSDLTGPPCSANGQLGVAGFQVVTSPVGFGLGGARMRVRADNLSGSRLDTSYDFLIGAVFTPTFTQSFAPTATRTPTQTRTRTATPPRTPTAILSSTPTHTRTATRRPTSSRTPTRTFTRSYTPTRTATAANTATPTLTGTATSTRTPTSSPTVTPTFTATYTLTPDLSCGGAHVSLPVRGRSLLLSDRAPETRKFKVSITNDLALTNPLTSDPTQCGARLQLVGTGRGDGSAVVDLPAAYWYAVGYPRAARGYRYFDPLKRHGVSRVRIQTDDGGGDVVLTGGGEEWPFRVTHSQGPIQFLLQIGNDVLCS
ncbi:MAG TPA: hypothetical protein VEB21_03585, partial [Terriglobales bacterium]|nr:hypothetical protein [Terriglobales bacterium]